MDKKTANILYVGLMLFAVLSIGYLFLFLRDNSYQCLKNPFVYGAERMENVECSCQQFNNQQCPAKFHFNDTTFSSGITECGIGSGLIQKIDLRALNISE